MYNQSFKWYIFLVICFVMLGCSPTVLPEKEEEIAQSQENNPPENNDENGSSADSGNGENEGVGKNPDEEGSKTPEEPGPFTVIQQGLPVPDSQRGAIVLSDTETKVAESMGRFSFRLLSGLYQGSSLVLSPLSIEMALSMSAHGARGETAREILATLVGNDTEQDILNNYNHHILEQLPAVDTSVCLNAVNGLIADSSAPLQDSYVQSISEKYYAAARNMDFSDFPSVKSVVNEWCNRVTKGLIPSILDDASPGATLTYLLNMLYMKAAWASPFGLSKLYADAPFQKVNGEFLKRDYIQVVDTLAYADMDSYSMARLNLGKTEQFSFTILLPKQYDGLGELVKSLPESSWTEKVNAMKTREVHLRLPVFQTESSYQLVEELQKMGIHAAFSPLADFSGMFSVGGVGIGKVVHKTKIQVDKDGIEGAAATIVYFSGTDSGPDSPEEKPEPIRFWADHPFVYVITEKTSGIVLFAGIYDGN